MPEAVVGGRKEKWVEGVKRYKLLVDVMYSM